MYVANISRITAALKVWTSIVASITTSLIGRVVIPVMMYVDTFKTDVILFIGIKRHNMMSH
jgi:hypothetical protein